MNRYGYDRNEAFRPLSPWAYFGYSLLFCIPLAGFVLLIVFSLSDQNINRRNFARSHWCGLLIALIVIALALAFGGLGALTDALRH